MSSDENYSEDDFEDDFEDDVAAEPETQRVGDADVLMYGHTQTSATLRRGWPETVGSITYGAAD